MAKKYENIENINKLVTGGAVTELSQKVTAAEKVASDILKKLNDLEEAAKRKKIEEAEAAARAAKEEAARIAAEKAEKERKEQEAKAQAEKAAQPKEQPQTTEKPAQSEANAKPAEKPAEPARQTVQKPAAQQTQQGGFRQGSAPRQENKTFINRDNRPSRPQQGAQTGGYRPNNQRPGAPYQPRPAAGQGARPSVGGRFGGAAPAPAVAANKGKNFGPDKKKQSFDRTYVEKAHAPMSKRALQKQQGASIDDFDENKSGYRKLRVKKDKQKSAQTIKIERAVVTTNDIPLKVLSEKLGITAAEITKRLFKEGIMVTVNGSIDYDTAALLAAGLGIELEYKPEKTAEEVLHELQEDTVEEIESLVPRAPVVTVMGHVDHGKTSLLDYIRKTSVTAGEAGGITQHIGAYTVTVNGKGITFIDTPGHEAFTAMRARGAQVTDIVILVVAADDGVMPQTVEAINHAKAANVSIIVAVNKMDKVGANPDKIKTDLTNYGLTPEEWGGDTVICPISCKTGEGIDNLLETLILTAEMKELLANPAREARGVVIEARLDKGQGPVATVLVQNGTLRTGDNLVTGTVTGKVRAMIDDKGKTVKEAGPSMAVNVLGLESVPNSGDAINAVSKELMKQVQAERADKLSAEKLKGTPKLPVGDEWGDGGELKNLNVIIKGDVQGSVEAVKQSVLKLTNDEVQIKVIHSAAGAVNESDVMLAESSKAIILAFNVRPDPKAKALAERSKVDVRTYRIIYDLLDEMELAMKGLRAPKYQDILLGKCEVRQTFKITGVGNIAGCYVLDGKIIRGGKLRIYRDNILIVEGGVKQLKRFKDDVKEVAAGFECGCAIEGFNDIKMGDIIECYLIEEVKV
ncbi:MAG: translation initiation factor IF-2 [Clostridia bacterium]|nr:translation initiation factor IF-2 [Clostridia bacterium]